MTTIQSIIQSDRKSFIESDLEINNPLKDTKQFLIDVIVAFINNGIFGVKDLIKETNFKINRNKKLDHSLDKLDNLFERSMKILKNDKNMEFKYKNEYYLLSQEENGLDLYIYSNHEEAKIIASFPNLTLMDMRNKAFNDKIIIDQYIQQKMEDERNCCTSIYDDDDISSNEEYGTLRFNPYAAQTNSIIF